MAYAANGHGMMITQTFQMDEWGFSLIKHQYKKKGVATKREFHWWTNQIHLGGSMTGFGSILADGAQTDFKVVCGCYGKPADLLKLSASYPLPWCTVNRTVTSTPSK